MDNNDYRSQYIKLHTDELLPDSATQPFNSSWNLIGRAEEEIGRKLEDGYSKEDFIRLFNLLKTTSIPIFHYYKHRISRYHEFLFDNGVISQEPNRVLGELKFEDTDSKGAFDVKYIKDFDMLQSVIDMVLEFDDRVMDQSFATHVSILYLAWCGVECEDAINILKSDVYDDHIVVAGKKIFPNEKIMRHIIEYRDAEGYDTAITTYLGEYGHVEMKYRPSAYLLRTTKSDRFNGTGGARKYITKFADIARKTTGINITYNNVYSSGVFSRVYEHEEKYGRLRLGDHKRVEQAFEKELGGAINANRRLREYRLFRRHFYQ